MASLRPRPQVMRLTDAAAAFFAGREGRCAGRTLRADERLAMRAMGRVLRHSLSPAAPAMALAQVDQGGR